jgi:hypothetical protein
VLTAIETLDVGVTEMPGECDDGDAPAPSVVTTKEAAVKAKAQAKTKKEVAAAVKAAVKANKGAGAKAQKEGRVKLKAKMIEMRKAAAVKEHKCNVPLNVYQTLIDDSWQELYLVRRQHPNQQGVEITSLDYFQNRRVGGKGNQLVGSLVLNGVEIHRFSSAEVAKVQSSSPIRFKAAAISAAAAAAVSVAAAAAAVSAARSAAAVTGIDTSRLSEVSNPLSASEVAEDGDVEAGKEKEPAIHSDGEPAEGAEQPEQSGSLVQAEQAALDGSKDESGAQVSFSITLCTLHST